MRLEKPSTSSKPQKILGGLTLVQKIVILVIIALGIIGFWIWQMQNQISSPFALNNSTDSNSAQLASSSPNSSINLLKKTDTDGDGLSDYAEIYIYHTSPYLADSDSDGISDLKEIEQGTNPNCPQGKNCNAITPLASSSSSNLLAPSANTGNSFNNLNTKSTSVSGSANSEQLLLKKVLSGQADVATLRQVLISSGISTKAQLDKISDADLLKSYQATLNSESSQVASSSSNNSSNPSIK